MDIETLIERAKAKDSHALETLYMMYFPKMLGLCIKIIKEDEDTAKDLVHDAFVLAFSSLHSLNTSERFGKWLSVIVRNVALKYRERKGKVDYVSITDEYEEIVDTDASSDSVVNQQDILNLVDKLPNGYGKVFRLYVIDGLSHKEIADILGIEAHSSSSQLSRAKAMLRRMMTDRRVGAILLFLIMSIPLYFFISREKSLQSPAPKIAEGNGKRKDININGTPKMVEDTIDVQRSVQNKLVISNTGHEDTIEKPDTTVGEIIVPDIQVAEHEQDSTVKADSIIPPLTLADYELATEDARKKSNKWQMLATGSLGPALAQNIYKLIVTGNTINSGDIDLPLPSLPTDINTWEDYSRYLHMIEHDNTPKDTLALMEIADRNQGDIVEHEQHDRPVTFGISLSKPLSERWSIETGLQYSILKSRATMGNGDYYIGKEQKIHYLGIPLRLVFRLADYKRLSVYSSAGMSLNIPVCGKVSSKYIVANTPAYTDSWHITPPVQWSTSFSMGLQYHVLPKMTLYVEPTLYWHIPNGSCTHTIWTEHPIMFSAPFGVRFTF